MLDQIMERAGSTILLMGTAILIGMLIGIPLGILSAVRQYSRARLHHDDIRLPGRFDAELFPRSRPDVSLRGRAQVVADLRNAHAGSTESVRDLVQHMIMPVTVLALAQLPLFMRYARSTMLEAMRQTT